MPIRLSISLIALIFFSCQTGKLVTLSSFPIALKEASAAEVILESNIMWTLEDHGNDSDLHAFNADDGRWITSVKVNTPNVDWEELTSDERGHLYIGDIGNNNGKRKEFKIYKLPLKLVGNKIIEVQETITFRLPPEAHKKNDFEAFFLWKDDFYLFSKNNKKGVVLKVPNKEGQYTAEFITYFKLADGDDNRITSADIRSDGEEVVLLNHDKIWRLYDYEGTQFF